MRFLHYLRTCYRNVYRKTRRRKLGNSDTCQLSDSARTAKFPPRRHSFSPPPCEDRHDFIDSCTMMSHYGYKLGTIIGPMENIKITTPTDFFVFRAMVKVHEDQQIFGL